MLNINTSFMDGHQLIYPLCLCAIGVSVFHSGFFQIRFDGFVKSPTFALCCISQSFNVRKVRLMITKFARLE